MMSQSFIARLLVWLRGGPIVNFVRKESEWTDYHEYVDTACLCKDPLVSCCVFTYNQEKYIRQCLESIVCQEASFPYEVLVCEDSSTDRTLEICHEIQRRFPGKVRVIHANRNYYHGALNFRRGYQLARGKYVAICEGDDFWCDQRKIADQVGCFLEDPSATICYTDFKTLSHDGKLSDPVLQRSGFFELYDAYKQEDYICERYRTKTWHAFATASIMVRRKVLMEFVQSELGRMMLALGDYPLRVEGAKKGRVQVVSRCCCVYRIGTGVCAESVRTGNRRLHYDGEFVKVMLTWPFMSHVERQEFVDDLADFATNESQISYGRDLKVGSVGLLCLPFYSCKIAMLKLLCRIVCHFLGIYEFVSCLVLRYKTRA